MPQLKGLEWLPREDGIKDHALHTSVHWGAQAPCTVYEKRPLKDPNTNNPVLPDSTPTLSRWTMTATDRAARPLGSVPRGVPMSKFQMSTFRYHPRVPRRRHNR